MARGVKIRRPHRKVAQRQNRWRTTKVRSGDVKAEWERKGSVNANYESLGLAANPNQVVSSKVGIHKTKPARPLHQLDFQLPNVEAEGGSRKRPRLAVADLPVPEDKPEQKVEPKLKGAKKPKLVNKWSKIDQEVALTGFRTRASQRPSHYLSEEDCLYIKPMVDKYGTDIEAMFRDIKLNKFQKTTKWLKRMVDRYNKFAAAHPELLPTPGK